MTRAGHRDRLERLCRYALRSPWAEDRLQLDGEGAVWLTLRHAWNDGTTHLRFQALELLERLAVLTPRPRVNLVLYYGVLAPRTRWRAAAVAWTTGPPPAEALPATEQATGDAQPRVHHPADGPERISGPS
jgi:hypothetical protein